MLSVPSQERHNSFLRKPIVLMLRMAVNKPHAIAAGVPSRHIICLDELTASLVSSAAIHPGMSTLVTNLITSKSLEDVPIFAPWMAEYASGLCKEVYSVRLRERFVGRTFRSIAQEILQETAGHAQLIGFQVRHRDQRFHAELSPTDDQLYERDARAFVIAPDLVAVKQLKSDRPSLFGGSPGPASPSGVALVKASPQASPDAYESYATDNLAAFGAVKSFRLAVSPKGASGSHADSAMKSPIGLPSFEAFPVLSKCPTQESYAPGDDASHAAGDCGPLQTPAKQLSPGPAAGPSASWIHRSFTSEVTLHKMAGGKGKHALSSSQEAMLYEIAQRRLSKLPSEPPPQAGAPCRLCCEVARSLHAPTMIVFPGLYAAQVLLAGGHILVACQEHVLMSCTS